jgi:hypothetical protein
MSASDISSVHRNRNLCNRGVDEYISAVDVRTYILLPPLLPSPYIDWFGVSQPVQEATSITKKTKRVGAEFFPGCFHARPPGRPPLAAAACCRQQASNPLSAGTLALQQTGWLTESTESRSMVREGAQSKALLAHCEVKKGRDRIGLRGPIAQCTILAL